MPFFTRNPRGGAQKPLDEADAAALRTFLRENGFGTLVAHAPYTLNACGKDEAVRDFAHRAMEEDLARLEAALPGQYYNFHPGSHVGQGVKEGVRLIAAQLNAILTPGITTTVLLETMAGKGSEVGRTFEELAAILDKVRLNEKVAVCLDTCHVWDGGYDIVHDLDGVLAQFDRVIGLNKLKALHVNDSLNPCGARKDRHAQIGEGHIGAEALCAHCAAPRAGGPAQNTGDAERRRGLGARNCLFQGGRRGRRAAKTARAGARLSYGCRPPRRRSYSIQTGAGFKTGPCLYRAAWQCRL